jgi:hypothetical protein
MKSLISNQPGPRVTASYRNQSVRTLWTAIAGLVILGPKAYAELQDSTRLTTEEIVRVFSGARDDAMVQDAAGTSAVNYWCADGTFINTWSNEQDSGRVIGRWRAVNDERCVVIVSGLPEYGAAERCGPILRDGEQYLSVNPDGSIHGVHTLAPMTTLETRAHCQNPTKNPEAT